MVALCILLIPALVPRIPTTKPIRARATVHFQLEAWVPSPEKTAPDIIETLPSQLAKVRALRAPSDTNTVEAEAQRWFQRGADPSIKVSGMKTDEASFTRLFTHETWKGYTDRWPIDRWLRTFFSWRYSTVLRAVAPISFFAALWAYTIAHLPRALLPRTSPVPMSLMGTALGLLLVFRTNNSYLRLWEARTLWSQMLTLTREFAQGVATALLFDKHVQDADGAQASAVRTCRYLAALNWELNGKLTGGAVAEDTAVLHALLPPEEAAWIGSQRSRPLQLLGCLRRELHSQYRCQNLPTHVHRKLEEDIRSLDLIIGSMERLFSSPLPPTMSRHIVRTMQLWLFGFPFVLAGTMAPLSTAVWVFATSYAFVGIDEVGVQVEQPFEIVPMTTICNLVLTNLEETFVDIPPGHPELSSKVIVDLPRRDATRDASPSAVA